MVQEKILANLPDEFYIGQDFVEDKEKMGKFSRFIFEGLRKKRENYCFEEISRSMLVSLAQKT